MRRTLLILAASLVLSACGRDEAEAPPLAFVPADTPYLFANLEPAPQALLDEWQPMMAQAPEMYRMQLRHAIRALERDDEVEAAEALALLRALQAELEGKDMAGMLDLLGMDMQARMALYGIGAVPVLRMQLANPARPAELVGRLQAQSGITVATARVDELDYWLFGPAELPLTGVAAVVGNHLVVSLAPRAAEPELLRTVFGLQRPDASLRDAATLAELNARFKYTEYGSGYIDTARMLALFTAASDDTEAAYLAALGIDKPSVDPVCASEYAALAAAWPRMSIGYTRFEAKGMDMRAVIEARSDLATDLMSLRAPSPGLAAAQGALLNFAMALKVDALPALASKYADRVSAEPWQCDDLQDLNSSFAELRTQLSGPAVYSVAPVLDSVHVIINQFAYSFGQEEPPVVSGKLLLGSPNPATLVAMAANFDERLRTLGLAPGSGVVALPEQPLMPLEAPMFAAMGDDALGIAIGAGEEVTLESALVVDESDMPLFVIGYSEDFYPLYFGFLEDMMSSTLADLGDADEIADMRESMGTMKSLYGDMLGAGEFRVEFTPEGIEILQDMSLR